VANMVGAALHFPSPTDDEWPMREISWAEGDSFSAWDDGRCVGHAAGFAVDTKVPGGARLATSAVTRVGVLPTHTRRGLLTEMMRQLLDQARSNGQVLASLRASEAVIYERFGFGVAGEGVSAIVRRRAMGPVRAPAEGTMRILPRDQILDVVPDVYERSRWRTGTISRTPFMWTRYLADATSGTKPSMVAVHIDPQGTVDGFVHYEASWREGAFGEESAVTGEVHDLFGVDAATERAMWAYLLDIDLVTEWRAEERPVDDFIRFAVSNTRGYDVRSRWDEQWLRLIDVEGALGGRTYRQCDDSVVVAVTDPLFEFNTGSWRIDSKGAQPTDDQPDIAVGITELGAAYLGGTSWRELADAGRVDVRRPAAIDDADTLFAERPAPFCGSFF